MGGVFPSRYPFPQTRPKIEKIADKENEGGILDLCDQMIMTRQWKSVTYISMQKLPTRYSITVQE